MVFFVLFLFFQHTLHINVFVCRSPFIHFYFRLCFFFLRFLRSRLIRMRNHCDEHTRNATVCFRLAHIFSENMEYYCTFEMLWI